MIRVGEKTIPWRKGLTLAQILAELNDPYEYAVIRLDGRLISKPFFETTQVLDNAEVILIPMIAGG